MEMKGSRKRPSPVASCNAEGTTTSQPRKKRLAKRTRGAVPPTEGASPVVEASPHLEGTTSQPRKKRLAKRTRGAVPPTEGAAGSELGATESLVVETLNDDCVFHLLSFFSSRQLLQLREVSRRWCSLVVCADSLWRPYFRRLFGPSVYQAADLERAWRGDKPISRSYSYYPPGLDEDALYANCRYKEDQEEPAWDEHSDTEIDPTGKLASKGKSTTKRGTGYNKPADEAGLVESIARMGQSREATGAVWFFQFVDACRRMPRMAELNLPEEFKRKVHEWCEAMEQAEGGDCHYIKRIDFSAVDLAYYPRADVHYRVHRLAVVLALLDINGYRPRMSDMVRIGFVGQNCTIPLARFCYAFLHGQEKQMVADLGLLNLSPHLLQAAMPPPLVKEEKERSYGWREFKEPALCPGVDGDFVPFVYFLSGLHGQKERNSYCLSENEETFGSWEDVVAAYCFRTPKKGWAPGFFNASFSWFGHAAVNTYHNHQRRHILVAKTKEMELVW